MRALVTYALTIICIVANLLCSCGNSMSRGSQNDIQNDSINQLLPDTIRVATLYSPTSYFIYRDATLGYDYSLVKQFAEDNNITFDIIIAPNMNAMVEMLESNNVDLIAYEIPIISEYRNRILHCGIENFSSQVLVQPIVNGEVEITDVTQLVGRDVYVEKDSKYQQRIENLNSELGGGIKIHIVDKDTLITEELIRMVSEGVIPLTIVDSDIARVNKTYYKDLDITLKLSFPQRSSWAVSKNDTTLANKINKWFAQETPKRIHAEVHKCYFELSKTEKRPYTIDFSKGYISIYDVYFKKYASQVGWDWRLMASQAYAESRFDSTAVSWAGARGIMQIMPATAKAYGLTSRIAHIDDNIRVASQILKKLDISLSKYVEDPQERAKFVIGAYNSGIGHIFDAIALAKKYGKNPQLWDENVAEMVLMKTKPEYYNDPVCKFGYFRGSQTYEYVNDVMDFYSRCKRYVPL